MIFQAVKNRVSVEGFAVQLRTAGGLMLLAAAAVLISACAPVVSVNERIPKGVEAKDLLTVRLATEGMAYSNQGRLVDAALKFHQALWLNPTAKNLQLSLASTYEKLGMPQEALGFYAPLLKESPADPTLTAGSARVVLRDTKYKDAYNLLERALWQFVDKGALGSAADQAQSISALGFRLGDQARALCFAEMAARLAPSPQRQLRWMRLLMATGAAKRGRVFMTAAQTDPFFRTDPDALMSQALLFYSEKDPASAGEAAQRALQKNPQDAIDKLELGIIRDISRMDLGIPPDNDEEKDARAARLKQAEDILSTRGLYWPAAFLMAVVEARQENSSD